MPRISDMHSLRSGEDDKQGGVEVLPIKSMFLPANVTVPGYGSK